jgi:hypothetical protein
MKAAVIILFISVNISAQTFTLPDLKIKQKEKGESVIYDFEKEKNEFILTDSSLSANPKNYNYKVSIQDITKISIHDGSNFWQMTRIGSAIGGFFGILIGLGIHLVFRSFDDDTPINIGGILLLGMAFAIPTGIVFGLIGSTIPYYESRSFSGHLNKKKQDLKTFLKKHRYRI